MAELATAIHLVMQAASVVVFPSLAVWSARTGGLRRLTGTTVSILASGAALALAQASAEFGNRLTPLYGYGYVAPRILALYALTFGLPVLSAALVAAFSTRPRPVGALRWRSGLGGCRLDDRYRHGVVPSASVRLSHGIAG